MGIQKMLRNLKISRPLPYSKPIKIQFRNTSSKVPINQSFNELNPKNIVDYKAWKNNIIEENKYFSGQISEHELREFQQSPNLIKQMWPQPSFNVEKMSEFICPDNIQKRKNLKDALNTSMFTPEFNIPISRERELAYERLVHICENGHISVHDFDNNPLWVFACHELLAGVDPSAATKLTVQFNLFGGTLLSIGTKKHHKLIEDIDKFQKVGCFGLSELGYGNNAVKMETKVTFDMKNDEFIVDTPSPLAQKYWITNGALHAHYCVVFGDLRIPAFNQETQTVEEGDTYGVHAFLVPIREQGTMQPLEGVTIQDMGHKMGLNGIDNAKLSFNKVKIPRLNMLDKFSQVSSAGEYTTTIEGKARDRFLQMADQLLSGRLCIASMSQGSSKALLAVATEYSCSRLSVGPSGESTVPIMAYRLQQRSLIPMIAKTIAIETALYKIKTAWALNRKGTPIMSNNTLIAQCCAIKAYSGWHANIVANKARERTGGQGFLSANRFGMAITGTHSSITAEGDNSVLMMKTISELVKEIKNNKGEQKNVAKAYLKDKFNRSIVGFISEIGQGKFDNKKGVEMLKNRYYSSLGTMQEKAALSKDEQEYLNVDKTDKERKRKINYHTTITKTQSEIQKAAMNYIEYLTAKSFLESINDEADQELKPVLEDLLQCYLLDTVKQDLTSFQLSRNFIKNNVIEHELDEICTKLAPNVLGIVDSFGYGNLMTTVPIARDWVKFNTGDNQGEVAGLEF